MPPLRLLASGLLYIFLLQPSACDATGVDASTWSFDSPPPTFPTSRVDAVFPEGRVIPPLTGIGHIMLPWDHRGRQSGRDVVNGRGCVAEWNISRGGGDLSVGRSEATLMTRAQPTLTVLLVALALFNDMLQMTMLLPIIPSLVSSPPPLGVKANAEVAMGIFFASKDLFQLLAAPLAGLLTSRTSPKAALALSTVGLGLATLIFAEATTFRHLLLARSCQGAMSAATMCGGLSMISEAFPTETRGAAMGMAYMGLAMGILTGPLIGGILFDRMGRRDAFRLAGTFVLANAVAQVVLMILTPSGAISEDKVSADASKRKRKNHSGPSALCALVLNRHVMAVTLATAGIHAVLGVIRPLTLLVLEREFGMHIVARSFVITVATGTYMVSTPLAGWLSDRIPRARLVALSLGLMVLSTFLFTLRSLGLWAINASVCALGLGLGFSASVGQALLADLVDRHELGEYSMAFALSDMADSLGTILGPVIGLAVSQRFGPSAGANLIGLLCLVLIPSLLRIP